MVCESWYLLDFSSEADAPSDWLPLMLMWFTFLGLSSLYLCISYSHPCSLSNPPFGAWPYLHQFQCVAHPELLNSKCSLPCDLWNYSSVYYQNFRPQWKAHAKRVLGSCTLLPPAWDVGMEPTNVLSVCTLVSWLTPFVVMNPWEIRQCTGAGNSEILCHKGAWLSKARRHWLV